MILVSVTAPFALYWASKWSTERIERPFKSPTKRGSTPDNWHQWRVLINAFPWFGIVGVILRDVYDITNRVVFNLWRLITGDHVGVLSPKTDPDGNVGSAEWEKFDEKIIRIRMEDLFRQLYFETFFEGFPQIILQFHIFQNLDQINVQHHNDLGLTMDDLYRSMGVTLISILYTCYILYDMYWSQWCLLNWTAWLISQWDPTGSSRFRQMGYYINDWLSIGERFPVRFTESAKDNTIEGDDGVLAKIAMFQHAERNLQHTSNMRYAEWRKNRHDDVMRAAGAGESAATTKQRNKTNIPRVERKMYDCGESLGRRLVEVVAGQQGARVVFDDGNGPNDVAVYVRREIGSQALYEALACCGDQDKTRPSQLRVENTEITELTIRTWCSWIGNTPLELILARNKLGPKLARLLSRKLINSHCRSLDLSQCEIGDLGFDHVCRNLAKCSSLKYLNLNDNGYYREIEHPGETSERWMFPLALSRCLDLRELHLKGMVLSGNALEQLVPALQLLTNLQVLDVSCSRLGRSKKGDFEALVKSLSALPNVRRVMLKNNGITSDEISILCNYLPNWTTLEEIDLQDNRLHNDECSMLLKALELANKQSPQDFSLRLVHLKGNKINPTKTDPAVIDYTLRKDNNTLITLDGIVGSVMEVMLKKREPGPQWVPRQKVDVDLGEAHMDDNGAKALRDIVRSGKCSNIYTMKCSNGRIGNEGAKAIAEILGLCPDLIKLDLSNNAIGNEGIKAISAGLCGSLEAGGKQCDLSIIHKLDVSGNKFDDSGAVGLCDCIEKLKSLTALDMSRNSIGTKGAAAVAKALKKREELNSEAMAEDQSGNLGTEYANMDHINLRNNRLDISEEVRKDLAAICEEFKITLNKGRPWVSQGLSDPSGLLRSPSFTPPRTQSGEIGSTKSNGSNEKVTSILDSRKMGTPV